jgi:NAD(P)-dependent dehydrogenase (short-subunit alcohol dehydrogenase family)
LHRLGSSGLQRPCSGPRQSCHSAWLRYPPGAEHGIRVNLINADAVFGDAEHPSGLWSTVGPDRARSRGLRPEQLPAYYRERNLLRAEVRPEHVGNAVVFFASNQTPTTGATLPVDGGLPDAFPR